MTSDIAETSISGAAINAHSNGSIAVLFAMEKDALNKELLIKEEKIDELKVRIYELQKELKTATEKTPAKRKTSKTKAPSVDKSLIDTLYGDLKSESAVSETSSQAQAKGENGVEDTNKDKVTKSKIKNKRKTQLKKASAVSKPNLKASTERPASRTSVISTESCLVCDTCAQSTSDKQLEEISEKYPSMKVSTFVNSKKKFLQADVNGDGTVDVEELTKILESSGLFFTTVQVRQILKTLDGDQNAELDFEEVLQVVSQLENNPNRRADIPQSLKDSKSQVCAVM